MRVRRIITKLYPKSVVDRKFDGIVDGLYGEGGELATLAEPTDKTARFFDGQPAHPKEERTGNLPPALEIAGVIAVIGALAATAVVGIEALTTPTREAPPASPATVTTVPSPGPEPTPSPEGSIVWLPVDPATTRR